MRDFLERLEQFAIDVILERRKDWRAGFLRFILGLLSHVYALVVNFRLFLYRNRIMREHTLGCTVISIGNLTVGGTGKTPVVEKFARALEKAGRKVAILSRGYKSRNPPFFRSLQMKYTGKMLTFPPRVVSDGKKVLLNSRLAGDEPFMLAKNLKSIPVVVDKDRVKAGLHAIDNFNVDTLLLDDGLQYLKLKHRLDIVLVDRFAPFGNERLLPRGTLREPHRNLRRASYIFITKCDGENNDKLIKRVRKYNRTAEIIECSHKALYLYDVCDENKRMPLDYLNGLEIGALSAIAVPESFEKGLEKLGAKIIARRRFADHHRFRPKEIEQFVKRCAESDIEAVITTEKDSVRLPKIKNVDIPIYYLRVEIEIINGEETWSECVRRICKPTPMLQARKFF